MMLLTSNMEGLGTGVLRSKREPRIARGVEELQCNHVTTVAAFVLVTSLLTAIGAVMGCSMDGRKSLEVQ